MISPAKAFPVLKRIQKNVLNEAGFRFRSSFLWLRAQIMKNEETCWLIGDGRSGTTWVSDLINRNNDYRELFEPFHPVYIEEMKCIKRHQYVRPGNNDEEFLKVSSKVFSGTFFHRRVDQNDGKLVHNRLLIKDIFANLFAFWASEKFPEIKIILLIRNPFAVALSKYKVRDWPWMKDPKQFLAQNELFVDYLGPFEDLISKVGDGFIERQILIWSIIHYVPLLQFNAKSLCIVFYEDFYRNPQKELLRIAHFKCDGFDETLQAIDSQLLKRPSKVSGSESNIIKGKSPINAWKNEIPPAQIDQGYKILNRFGLDRLYDDDVHPVRSVIEGFYSR